MSTIFPDHSAREEPILTIGEAELLKKDGEKILRWRKATYGSETSRSSYDRIRTIFAGRVLNVGLGMGSSVEAILARAEVLEVLAQEIHPEIADLFEATHEPDARLTIERANGIEARPDGPWDAILFELEVDSPSAFTEALAYIAWALGALSQGGILAIPYSPTRRALADCFVGSATIATISEGSGLASRPRWIFMEAL